MIGVLELIGSGAKRRQYVLLGRRGIGQLLVLSRLRLGRRLLCRLEQRGSAWSLYLVYGPSHDQSVYYDDHRSGNGDPYQF